MVLKRLRGRNLTLVIDEETGDRKKKHITDYVKHQYIWNLGKLIPVISTHDKTKPLAKMIMC